VIDAATFTFIKDCVTIFGVIIGVGYYVAITQIQIKNRKAQLFLNLYDQFKSKAFMETWTEMFFEWKWDDYDEFWAKYGPGEPEEFGKFLSMCAYFEGIGLLVDMKLIDLEIVDKLMAAPIIWMWEKLDSVIFETRKRFNAPRLWEWNEYLYNELLGRIGKPELYFNSEK
jgi:hypothetical protein